MKILSSKLRSIQIQVPSAAMTGHLAFLKQEIKSRLAGSEHALTLLGAKEKTRKPTIVALSVFGGGGVCR